MASSTELRYPPYSNEQKTEPFENELYYVVPNSLSQNMKN